MHFQFIEKSFSYVPILDWSTDKIVEKLKKSICTFLIEKFIKTKKSIQIVAMFIYTYKMQAHFEIKRVANKKTNDVLNLLLNGL